MRALEQTIGYAFKDRKLLLTALTHSSYSGEKHAASNQRLEFLGDAVLQLTMSDRLYLAYPDLAEGDLSRLRARSVQEGALHKAAIRLHLGEHLRLSHGEELAGGRERPSILADAVEALLGAIYLDGGMEPARAFVESFLPTAPETVAQDSKTALQELLQKGGGDTPQYEILSEEGPPHARRFHAQALWNGRQIGKGEGASKKAAEQAAALDALRELMRQGK